MRFNVCRNFFSDRSASIAILFALALPVFLGVSALAIDLGSAYLERRTLQMAADDAALAAAEWPGTADSKVRAVLDADSENAATFQIVYGAYTDLTSVDPDKRFVVAPSGNAVRVIVTRAAPVYFARILGLAEFPMSASADAQVVPTVSLSAGSRLAAADPSILNSVSKPLTGINLSLGVLDYQSLAKSEIPLGSLLKALPGGTKINAKVKDILSQPIPLSTLIQDMADVQMAAGDLVGASILRKASQQIASSGLIVTPSDIIKVDDTVGNLSLAYPSPALDSNFSALNVLNAGLLAKQVGDVVTTGLTIPGIASTTIDMIVGDAVQKSQATAVGQGMPSVQTEQLKMRAQVATTGLVPILNVGLNFPIEIVAAGGTATVVSTNCSSDSAKNSVTVQAMPGVVKLAIGKFVGALKDANTQDRLSPADLASVLLGTVSGSSYVSVSQITPVTLKFTGAEIGNGTTKTAKTSQILQSLIASLFGNLDLSVNIAGTAIQSSGISSAIGVIASALVQPLSNLLSGILDVAGVSLGELDVRVDSLTCNDPKLIM